MAAMNKAKHAFGNLSDVQNALNQGKIDAYDILFLDGNTEPKIGWIDANGEFRLVKNETDLSELETELENKADAEDLVELENQIMTKADAAEFETLKTEVANKVDASEVQTMIEEHSSSLIEVIEF